MKVAIYCRVSRPDQDISIQERMCREYCERTANEVYAVYKDEGVSGAKESRPAFDELLKDLRAFKFNCVMVTKLDRMGRSLQHLLSLITEFTNKGVHFAAVTQNIDTSSAIGRLQLQIMGAFAEFERNLISERTKDAIAGNPNVGKRGPDKRKRRKRGATRTALVLVEKR